MKRKFIITRKNFPAEPKTVTTSLRLDPKLKKQYEDLAYSTGRSRNELMVQALQYALENLVELDSEEEKEDTTLPNEFHDS